MKIIKNVILTIVGIIVLILLIGLFVNGKYDVEREVTINKPTQEVFAYIKLLKNQDNFSVWAAMDPNMKKEFKGEDGTVGFISAWESNNEQVGKGEQEILKIDEGNRIDFELRFFEPFEAKDHAYMTTESVTDSTTLVKWGFNGEMPYPSNLMLLAMDMEEMLAPSLQDGLNNLKEILESETVQDSTTQMVESKK